MGGEFGRKCQDSHYEYNDNEGHLGWIIQQVTDSTLPNIIIDQPNHVLVNVGTNNTIQNNGVSTTSD